MMRSFSNRILGGVCGGLGQTLLLSATGWRILFILLTPLTLGAAGLLYLFWWWTMPQQSLIRDSRPGFFHIILLFALPIIVIGGWIFQNRLVGASGQALYPLLMLLLGCVLFLLRQIGKGRGHPLMGLVVTASAVILLLQSLDLIPAGIADLIARGWPALLVFAGLSIILRDRMRFGGLLALILSAALVGGIVTAAFSSRTQQIREENQIAEEQPINETVSLLQINVEALATDVEFLPSDDRVVRARFVGSDESSLESLYEEAAGGLATFTLREAQKSSFPMLESLGRGRLRIEVPTGLAVAISFLGQDGDATFTLRDISLERLDFTLERGDALVSLPVYNPLSPSVINDPGDFVAREGSVTIRIPEEVGGRFVLNGSPRDFPQFDDTRYLLLNDGAGGTLEARNYDTFEIKLRYVVTTPRGTIRLEVDSS